MTWVRNSVDMILQRKLTLVDRIFGAAPPPSPPTLRVWNPPGALEQPWCCDERGHVHIFGDDGCVYCSEVD